MRIDFKHRTLPLLAVLLVACSGLADPDSSAPPASEGESTFALGDSPDDEDVANGGQAPYWPPAVQSCEVAGQRFPDGSSVPSGDSCNITGSEKAP